MSRAKQILAVASSIFLICLSGCKGGAAEATPAATSGPSEPADSLDTKLTALQAQTWAMPLANTNFGRCSLTVKLFDSFRFSLIHTCVDSTGKASYEATYGKYALSGETLSLDADRNLCTDLPSIFWKGQNGSTTKTYSVELQTNRISIENSVERAQLFPLSSLSNDAIPTFASRSCITAPASSQIPAPYPGSSQDVPIQDQIEAGVSPSASEYFYTRPQVDIVVLQDDSDSTMFAPISAFRSQLLNFARSISRSSDYRFIVMPLLTSKDSAYVKSKYMLASNCDVNDGFRCLPTESAAMFNALTADQGWVTQTNSAIANRDYGMVGMRNNLNVLRINGFLREGARTIVLNLTNGNDAEGAIVSTRSDGVTYISGYDNTAVQQHAAAIGSLNNGRGIELFSGIANGTVCYGHSSQYGSRYVYLSALLNSQASGTAQTFDLCSQVPNLLAAVVSKAETTAADTLYDKLVIESIYEPHSITVHKNGVAIPNSTTNGWSYIGFQTGLPTAYFPFSGNLRTGYAIQLNGTAAHYKATDKMTVYYMR
jgi:hypothetical protein